MRVEADNKLLEYSGRIDFDNPKEPEFVFPCSYVKIKFVGKEIKAVVTNRNNYWDNYLGVIVDGVQSKIRLSNDENIRQSVILAKNLENKEHEVMLFKRQDSCHMFKFLGFVLEDNAQICVLPPMPTRRIEVYGDSVSAGEVSEAVEFVGQEDPDWHKGEFSNSYYSYSWITARKLNAQIHDIAQGGIALMDNTGWFNEPDYIGMESAYDKIQYNPAFGVIKNWNFDNYVPHVVIVAIGQNDNHPYDYMKEDYNCEQAVKWREHYYRFVSRLREIYSDAHIILKTTILNHDENWDRSIDEVCSRLKDDKIHHFMYSNNGKGTPGHIRQPEAEKMADELCEFINSLGNNIWN